MVISPTLAPRSKNVFTARRMLWYSIPMTINWLQRKRSHLCEHEWEPAVDDEYLGVGAVIGWTCDKCGVLTHVSPNAPVDMVMPASLVEWPEGPGSPEPDPCRCRAAGFPHVHMKIEQVEIKIERA